MAVVDENRNEQPSVQVEEENSAGKRGREQGDDSEGERGSNKNPKIEAVDDDDKKEEGTVRVILGPKTFGSSEEMFNYFHQLVHYKWSTDLDFNEYEYMVIMDLLKKGHTDPESKIGGGIKAFQVRNHPLFKSKCLFLIREDGSTDDFSFRKCVDKILPMPENMKPSSNGKFGLGRGGRGGRGRRVVSSELMFEFIPFWFDPEASFPSISADCTSQLFPSDSNMRRGESKVLW